MRPAEAVTMVGEVLFLHAVDEVVEGVDLLGLIWDFGFQAWSIVSDEGGGGHVEVLRNVIHKVLCCEVSVGREWQPSLRHDRGDQTRDRHISCSHKLLF